MPRLIADREICSSYGNCVATAPDFYDVDDSGIVIVLRDVIDASERQWAEEAVRNCPADALSIEDDR